MVRRKYISGGICLGEECFCTVTVGDHGLYQCEDDAGFAVAIGVYTILCGCGNLCIAAVDSNAHNGAELGSQQTVKVKYIVVVRFVVDLQICESDGLFFSVGSAIGDDTMQIDTNTIVSITEANQNFSRVTRIAEKNGQAVIFKNNRPKYMVVDLENSPILELTDDEKIDIVAARILKRFKPAFEELAKGL